MTDPHRNQKPDRWHVGKEIPLAMMFAIATQTAGGIWFAATQTAKLDSVGSMVAELKQSQYTVNDARRDMLIGEARDKDMARRIDILEVEHRAGRIPGLERVR